jgi:S1-C subfamily serine protease
MKKAPLYSRSRRPGAASSAPVEIAPSSPVRPERPAAVASALRAFVAQHERRLWAGAVVLLIAGAAWQWSAPRSSPQWTLEQIDLAMRKSIDEKPLPSPATRAYDAIIPSVVRVVGLLTEGDDGSAEIEANRDGRDRKPVERGVGSGVVIVDNGTILTNLHVVLGAKRIKVTFHDGLESEARLVNVMPEHDLAVLRANKIPDDLFAATMRSTANLAPGDQVIAVGFPFGIGPSVSSGVVSGLKREFRSPEGDRTLTNLIQFDAAANPGNSGGPLVTMEGEVVGIVTAILNPNRQRTFIGIGFAVPIENAAAGVGMPPF